MALAVTRKTEKFDLKTVDGGWVEIRRMTHGEKQKRRSFNSKMKVNAKSRRDIESEIETFNAQAENFDLQSCVVDHNLTYMADEVEQQLDFRNSVHVAMIDGIVVEEIATLIDKVNNFEDDEETGK